MPIRRADDKLYTLATAATSTATGVNSGAGVAISGGEYHFMVEGTVGGSTISLQIQVPNSSNWTDVQIYTGSVVKFTTLPSNQSGIDLPAGQVRMAATGGSPSGLNAYLVGLG